MLDEHSVQRYVVIMSTSDQIARNLRVAAAEKDWTLTKVAEASGMSKQALSHRLRGTTSIRIEELLAWAEVLDVPLSRLLRGVGDTRDNDTTTAAAK